MAKIREELTLVDSFSGTFNQFNNAATASIYTAQSFKNALDQFSEGFLDGLISELESTNEGLNEAASGGQRAAKGSNEARTAQKRVTDETKATADAAAGWVNQIKSAVAALGVAKLSKEFIEQADSIMLINQRLEAVGVSQQDAFLAAQRSRAEYSTISNLISGIERNASKTFTPKESVQFAENMSKAFKVAGADQSGIASATLQLNQALASGVLRGEEFNAVNENAHNIIQLIADEMNEPVEKMKDLASEGKITGDIIKNAVLGATNEINSEFDKIPMTFADITTLFGNYLNNALSGKYLEWSEFLNSDEGMEIISEIANALVFLAEIGANGFMAIAHAVQFVHDNIEFFRPLFYMLIAAVTAYEAVQIAAALSTAAAWATANAPLLLTIMAIGVAIGVARNFGVTFAQIGNIVGQIVGYIYATVHNSAMSAYSVVEWVCTNYSAIMNNTGIAVIGVINAIGQTALEMVSVVASAIDSVFGSNLSGAVATLSGNLQSWADSYGEYQKLSDLTVKDYLDVNATVAEFGSIGESIGGKLDNIGGTLDGIFSGVNGIGDFAGATSDAVAGNGEIGKVGSVGKVDTDVRLSDEDLQVYRDLAEQRYMNRIELQTLAPNINVSIPEGSNLDATDVANAIKAVLVEQMSANTAIAH